MLDEKKHESLSTPLSHMHAVKFLAKTPGWKLSGNVIEKEFQFKNFRESISFVDKLANLAEELDHHPGIHIYYDKVRLNCTTHKVGGLSPLDFTLAERIDGLGLGVSVGKES